MMKEFCFKLSMTIFFAIVSVSGVAAVTLISLNDRSIESMFSFKKKQPKVIPKSNAPAKFELRTLGNKSLGKKRFVEVFCVDGYKYVTYSRFGNGSDIGMVQAREIVNGQEQVARCL